MKKRLGLLLFLLLTIFSLTGCGTLDITLNEDGSGEFQYVFSENSFYTPSEVKQEIEDAVDEINDSEGEGFAKIKKLKEKNGEVEAVIEIKKVFTKKDSSNLFATVQDILAYKPSILEDLEAVNGSKEEADFAKDDKLKDLAVVHLRGLDDTIKTTVKVPGKVAYVSDGTLVKGEKNTVKVDGSSTTIVYKPGGSGFPTILIVLLLVGVAGIGTFLFMKKKKGNASPISSKEGGIVEN